MLTGAQPDQPEGSATFGWHLSPIFAKPKPKHH